MYSDSILSKFQRTKNSESYQEKNGWQKVKQHIEILQVILFYLTKSKNILSLDNWLVTTHLSRREVWTYAVCFEYSSNLGHQWVVRIGITKQRADWQQHCKNKRKTITLLLPNN